MPWQKPSPRAMEQHTKGWEGADFKPTMSNHISESSDEAYTSSSGSSASSSCSSCSIPGKGEKSNTFLSQWFGCKAMGPGLLVCLADTDFGCLEVAAQSGARWGYSLLLLQVVLIPILFLAQELTVRLGVHTKAGHTACIRKHFGCRWAWFACILLVFECTCAMMSEMSGVAAVGELWGLNRDVATGFAAVIIVAVVFSCNYQQIEMFGITLGLFELTFVLTMVCFHPSPRDIFLGSRGVFVISTDREFVKLISANIGAVVMPWMIYFQQSAVVARGLVTNEDLAAERTQTLLGSILTQLVMIGALVTLAAAHQTSKDLKSVHDIVNALSPVLGRRLSMVLLSLGFFGGSLCAAVVVSLAASWAISEAMGLDEALSLNVTPKQAPVFYGCFLMVISVGVLVLMTGVSTVQLSAVVELINGLLLPFTIGFLFLLATGEALPAEVRVGGLHKAILFVIFSICVVVSTASAIYGLVGETGWQQQVSSR